MEYEDIYPPPWETIRENVNHSDAVFVLLSRPLLNHVHTNNWVSFEIGLAANSRKLLQPANLAGLDVYVFEPIDERIDFPVPYCTYYMLYEITEDHLIFLKDLIRAKSLDLFGTLAVCPYVSDCGIVFNLLTKMEQFACPACRRNIGPSTSADVQPRYGQPPLI